VRTGWLSRAGPYRIERLPCPYINRNIDLSVPPTGVVHTTEGGWNSAMSVFRRHYAPTFLVGVNRIAQLVPLGKMCAALEHPSGYPETNLICRAQIEVVGFSSVQPYQFVTGTLDALAELLAVLETECEIPLRRNFPDAMPPLPWATRSFRRRRTGAWGTISGWYGHVEVPGNSHWDPGAYRWAELLSLAIEKGAPPTYVYDIVVRNDKGQATSFSGIKHPGSKLKKYGVAQHDIVEFWGRRKRA